MIQHIFIVRTKLGLHSRPASMFVRTATKYRSKIMVIRKGQQVDGKSIMGLLMLAAENGAKLKVIIDGEDEKNAFDDLKDLFERKFEEK